MIQWEKDDLDSAGLVKIDLLGLGMMSVLEQAIPLIKSHEGLDVDLARATVVDDEYFRAGRDGRRRVREVIVRQPINHHPHLPRQLAAADRVHERAHAADQLIH